MELSEIVSKLIGPVYPLGCSGQDMERLRNVNKLGELASFVIEELMMCAEHRLSHEDSRKAVGRKAQGWLDEIKEQMG